MVSYELLALGVSRLRCIPEESSWELSSDSTPLSYKMKPGLASFLGISGVGCGLEKLFEIETAAVTNKITTKNANGRQVKCICHVRKTIFINQIHDLVVGTLTKMGNPRVQIGDRRKKQCRFSVILWRLERCPINGIE